MHNKTQIANHTDVHRKKITRNKLTEIFLKLEIKLAVFAFFR